MQRGALAGPYIVAAADYCLDKQRNTTVPWKPSWGVFIEAAQAGGNLSEEQWTRYALQSLAVTFQVRPTIRQGDPVPLALHGGRVRVGAMAFAAQFGWEAVRIDGRLSEMR